MNQIQAFISMQKESAACVFYGAAQAGKTHLLRAIADRNGMAYK